MTDHDIFEAGVVEHLRTTGWTVPASMTYHDALAQQHVRGIAARKDPTSRSIRGQADLIAYVDDAELSTRVEIKTVGPRHRNLAVELFALCEHLYRSRMGCHCVYAVRHLAGGSEYGFHVDDALVDAIEAVHVPGQLSAREMFQLVEWTGDALGRVEYVRKPDLTRGSGTPFVLINAARLARFREWPDEFETLKEIRMEGVIHATN